MSKNKDITEKRGKVLFYETVWNGWKFITVPRFHSESLSAKKARLRSENIR